MPLDSICKDFAGFLVRHDRLQLLIRVQLYFLPVRAGRGLEFVKSTAIRQCACPLSVCSEPAAALLALSQQLHISCILSEVMALLIVVVVPLFHILSSLHSLAVGSNQPAL